MQTQLNSNLIFQVCQMERDVDSREGMNEWKLFKNSTAKKRIKIRCCLDYFKVKNVTKNDIIFKKPIVRNILSECAMKTFMNQFIYIYGPRLWPY